MISIFDSTLFFYTGVCVGFLLVVPILLINVLNTANGNYGFDCLPLSNFYKWYSYFIEFCISVSSIFMSAWVYYYFTLTVISEGSTFVQLFLIIISVIAMNYLSKKNTIIFDRKDTEIISTIRLLASLYATINLMLIKYLENSATYDSIILCYLGLFIGRFVFFDSSLRGVFKEFTKMINKIGLFFLMIGFTVSVWLITKSSVSPSELQGYNIITQFAIIYFAMMFGVCAASRINGCFISK